MIIKNLLAKKAKSTRSHSSCAKEIKAMSNLTFVEKIRALDSINAKHLIESNNALEVVKTNRKAQYAVREIYVKPVFTMTFSGEHIRVKLEETADRLAAKLEKEESLIKKLHGSMRLKSLMKRIETADDDYSIKCKKVGPTVWTTIIMAQTKDDAQNYIKARLQKMIGSGMTEVSAINRIKDIAKNNIVIGQTAYKRKWNAILKDLKAKDVVDNGDEACVIGIKGFMKKGYKIVSRVYMKPSVRALAKPVLAYL